MARVRECCCAVLPAVRENGPRAPWMDGQVAREVIHPAAYYHPAVACRIVGGYPGECIVSWLVHRRWVCGVRVVIGWRRLRGVRVVCGRRLGLRQPPYI